MSAINKATLPIAFDFRDKRFILRSGILHEPGHFVGFASCPEGWVFGDGMKNIPRLQLFGKNEVDKLQGNRRMDMVFCEVTEASDPMPGID